MYLIYVDESGTPDINESENFVLGATIIHEKDWFEIDKKVTELKENFFPGESENIEIHMCDIVHRKRSFSKKDVSQRNEIIESILDLISNIDLKTVYVVIKKDRLVQRNLDIRLWAYNFLFERICYNLKYLNTNPTQIDYGLLLFDSISRGRNNEIWRIFQKLFKRGSCFGYESNTHLVDGPIFSDSKIRSPLQLADCIAYIVNHHNKMNKNKDASMREILENGFELIESKMHFQKKYCSKIFP